MLRAQNQPISRHSPTIPTRDCNYWVIASVDPSHHAVLPRDTTGRSTLFVTKAMAGAVRSDPLELRLVPPQVRSYWNPVT